MVIRGMYVKYNNFNSFRILFTRILILNIENIPWTDPYLTNRL